MDYKKYILVKHPISKQYYLLDKLGNKYYITSRCDYITGKYYEVQLEKDCFFADTVKELVLLIEKDLNIKIPRW